MSGSIDLFAGDRSISGVNNFKVSHNPLDQLDTGLAGMVGLDSTLQNITDGLQHFLDLIKDFLLQTLENLTGLNFTNGPLEFIDSLVAAIQGLLTIDGSAMLQWLNNATGLVFDQGPADFLASLIALLTGTFTVDWITDFESATGLNVSNGPADFLASLVALLTGSFTVDWITDFESATGLDLSNGPAAFLASLVALLTQSTGAGSLISRIVAQIETLTGLVISQGPVAFLNSLIAALTATFGIANVVAQIETLTGLVISKGPVAFLTSLVTLLTSTLTGTGSLIEAIVKQIETWTGLVIRSGPVAFLTSLVGLLTSKFVTPGALTTAIANFITQIDLTAAVNKVIADIAKAIGGSGVDTLAKLTAWFTGTGVGTFIDTIVKQIETWTGLVIRQGPVAFLTSLVALLTSKFVTPSALTTAIANFITQLDLTAAINKVIKDISQAIGGSTVDTLAKLTAWFNSSIMQVIAKIQEIIDGIIGVWNPGAAVGGAVSGVIDAISGIFGIANGANTAAAQAQASVAAIIAGQAGGYFDEFDYTLASNLPTNQWTKTSSYADGYGPDGAGNAVFKPSGTAIGWTTYVQNSKPLMTPDMQVTCILSKIPGFVLVATPGWLQTVQANPNNQECYAVECYSSTAQFFKVSAGGTFTKLSTRTIPSPAVGIPYTFKIVGNTLTLLRNGIVAATHSGVTPLSGRHVGFGSYKISYVGAPPMASFAGITWQTAT